MGSCAFVQTDRATWAGTNTYPGSELFVIAIRVAGRENQVDDVLFDGFLYLDPVDLLARVKNYLLDYGFTIIR